MEKDGSYWGPPQDDDAAVRELEKLHKHGAQLLVFLWPAFWWLDYYAKLHHYLVSSFRRVRGEVLPGGRTRWTKEGRTGIAGNGPIQETQPGRHVLPDGRTFRGDPVPQHDDVFRRGAEVPAGW